MDHDAARAWIDDAAVTPGARNADDGVARAARAHLAACPDCAAYDVATRRALLKLDLAQGPSPEVRTRLLASARRLKEARRESAQPQGSQPWWRGAQSWRYGLAMLVLAFVAAVAGAWWAQNQRPDHDVDQLPDAVAMMTTLASEPGAEEVMLRDAAGTNGGLAVISAATHRMAVFATGLPQTGASYHCYVERDNQRTWIGTMYVAPGVQFWAGAMDSALNMQPGDTLVVALDIDQPAALRANL
jgi:hypothetical protein